MKGITKNYRKHFSILVIILLLLVISACGGVAPDNGSSGTDSPTISSFTSTSTSITEGESVTLSWVTNASAVSIDQGIGTVTAPSGSTTVTPASTTTYTLTVTNSAGSSTNSITITVSPDETTPSSAPVINSFIPSSNIITVGGSVTLSWVTTGAITVYLKQVSGSGSSTGTVALSGSETVYPSETTTYTLEAANSAGTTTDSIIINVNPAAIIEQTITIQPGPEGKDSSISSLHPDENYGDGPNLSMSYREVARIYRAYIQFDLGDLPDGAVILSATLQLYRWGLGGLPSSYVGAYRLKGPWQENTITWNTRCGYDLMPEYIRFVDSFGWISWDITDLVQRWLDGDSMNYGVCLRAIDEATALSSNECYSSDEITHPTWCPKLEITYQVPVDIFYF